MPPFVLCLVFISYTYILFYIANSNFKISTSEYLRCASKCAISRLNDQKFSGLPGEGSPAGRGPPLRTPPPSVPSAPRPLGGSIRPQTKILPTPLLSFSKIQNGDILVLANPGPPGKWTLKQSSDGVETFFMRHTLAIGHWY